MIAIRDKDLEASLKAGAERAGIPLREFVLAILRRGLA